MLVGSDFIFLASACQGGWPLACLLICSAEVCGVNG